MHSKAFGMFCKYVTEQLHCNLEGRFWQQKTKKTKKNRQQPWPSFDPCMEFYAAALNALPSEVSETTVASTLLGLQTVIIQILSQAIKKLHCAPHKVLLINQTRTEAASLSCH